MTAPACLSLPETDRCLQGATTALVLMTSAASNGVVRPQLLLSRPRTGESLAQLPESERLSGAMVPEGPVGR